MRQFKLILSPCLMFELVMFTFGTVTVCMYGDGIT